MPTRHARRRAPLVCDVLFHAVVARGMVRVPRHASLVKSQDLCNRMGQRMGLMQITDSRRPTAHDMLLGHVLLDHEPISLTMSGCHLFTAVLTCNATSGTAQCIPSCRAGSSTSSTSAI